ncbi:MAG: FkbM family methyltransferase [Ignavibacteriales bacterium]|nr:FkbM family methyltransferase [Ignavibacteriales bacterium]
MKILYCLNRKDCIVNRGNTLIKFNNDGDDQELLYIANWHKYYNEEFPKLKDLLKEGDVVIDVGANLGFFTLMISRLIGEKGKIFCFEPSKVIYDKLKINISINNITNVIIENMGLGVIEEEKILKRDKRYSGMSSIILNSGGAMIEEMIAITTIDNYIKDKNIKIKFIKIDTEGFEPQVLKGALNLIKSQQPIIYIELGGGKFFKSSVEALNILIENEYTLSINEDDLKYVRSGTNFIAFPKKINRN